MKRNILLGFIISVLFCACEPYQEDAPNNLGDAATAQIGIKQIDGNNYEFFVDLPTNVYLVNWNFGNGQNSSEEKDVVNYVFKGTYKVSLTVFGKGGSNTYTKDLEITSGISFDDLDPAIFTLTGYDKEKNTYSKSWVWDRAAGATSVGPPVDGASDYNDPIDDSWWRSAEDELSESGCYDDEYIFHLDNSFTYENICGPSFLYRWDHANFELGTSLEEYADSPFPYSPPSSSWDLVRDENDNLILSFTNGGVLGMYAGVHTYQIVELTDEVMWVRYTGKSPNGPDGKDREEWTYHRFVMKK